MAAWNGHVLPSTCQVYSGRWPMTQFMHIRSGGVRVDRAPEKLNHSFCLLLHACSYNSSLLWHLPGGATCLLTQFIYSFRNCPRATHKISRRTRNFTLQMQNQFIWKFVYRLNKKWVCRWFLEWVLFCNLLIMFRNNDKYVDFCMQ